MYSDSLIRNLYRAEDLQKTISKFLWRNEYLLVRFSSAASFINSLSKYLSNIISNVMLNVNEFCSEFDAIITQTAALISGLGIKSL